MNSFHILFVFLVGLVAVTRGQANQDNYTAAAIQYPPRGWKGLTYSELLMYNLPYLEADMMLAVQGGAQILVFPEGIFYWIAEGNRDLMESFCENLPSVFNGSPSLNPCLDFTPEEKIAYPVLNAMSCLAQKLSVGIVVNMCDVQYCNQTDEDCPSDGRNQYNTEIAVSSTGQYMARYHKTHLAGEDTYFNQPEVVEVVYFDTTFDVRFGMFTCYDLEFNYPAETLVGMGITNFVYSASWVNTPPLFGAMIIQQGWSRASSSNLIASNSGASSVVAGGGVYSAGWPAAAYFNPDNNSTDKVLVATIPKHPNPQVDVQRKQPLSFGVEGVKRVDVESEACDIYGLQGNCTYFTASPGLNGTLAASTTGTLGSPISCSASFSVSATNPDEEVRYVLLAFSGYSLLPNTTSVLKMQACLIFQCTNFSVPGLSCLPTWDSVLALDYVNVQADNFLSSVEVLPLYGVGSAQVASPSYISFDTSSPPSYTISTTPDQVVDDSLYVIGILSLLAP